jgi:hypothetical protein
MFSVDAYARTGNYVNSRVNGCETTCKAVKCVPKYMKLRVKVRMKVQYASNNEL